MSHTPPETRPEAPEAGLSRDSYALLAQANLLRIRGCWDEAVAHCMTVLQAAPDNASAQSLLGDIYENQGRIDEAIQWYRMALDLHPDSPADALKLNRLLQRKAQVPSGPPPAGRTRRFPIAPERALRLGAYTAAFLTLLLVLSAPVITQHRSVHAPAALADRTISAPPVVVPPAATAPPGSGAAGAVPPGDPGEQAVVATLRAAPELAGPATTLLDAQYDPRGARLSLTLLCRPADASSAGRSVVLRDALRAVQAAARLTADQGVAAFTVRCLLDPAGGDAGEGTPLVFVADTTRAALPGDGTDLDALTAAQLQAPFTQPWWSPTLTS